MIISWFKLWGKQKAAENELVDAVIKSMTDEPERWEIGEHVACYGGLRIWVGNSPYGDMTINGRRLPRRGELRRALGYCLMKQNQLILQGRQDKTTKR